MFVCVCVSGEILDRMNLTEVFEADESLLECRAEERRLQVPKSLTKGGKELR